jgi:glycosyltransferase involved in cell wall biosynthesis
MYMKVSIIVPAFNEEKNIKDFLIEISSRFPESEIIVVCNGCTDRTPEIAKSIRKSNVKTIVLPEPGKGAAVLKGFEMAENDYLGFVDADRAFRIEDIEKIVDELKKYDCVIASKWKGQKFFDVNWPITKKIPGRVWNFLVKHMLKLDFEDTQAGVKFLRREVYEAIDKNFICTGFEFDIELLLKIKRTGFRIKEIYTPVQNSKKSSFSISHTPRMFYNLFRLWLRY